MTYVDLAAELGAVVEAKATAYGDSAGKTGAILAILAPDGLRPEQYGQALLVVRVLDKLARVMNGADGEDPWQDVAGYGLIGLRMARQR